MSAQTPSSRQGQQRAAGKTGLATWRQLRLAEAELRDNWVARRQELKPIVFSDYDLESKRFVIRNVGGGFAVNVIGLVPTKDGGHEMPYLFGSLASGDSRALHAEEIYAGFLSKHVLLAEGAWTRTAQWNPTLNVRNRWESVSHANGVADGGKTILEARDLDTYLAANWKDLQAQLKILINGCAEEFATSGVNDDHRTSQSLHPPFKSARRLQPSSWTLAKVAHRSACARRWACCVSERATAG